MWDSQNTVSPIKLLLSNRLSASKSRIISSCRRINTDELGVLDHNPSSCNRGGTIPTKI